MKENLLLLKDYSDLRKTRFTSIWQLFQRIFILMCLMILLTKYNNTFHRTIKMKPINVISDSYAEYNVDSNKKDPKFKVGDRVRISKYKNVFLKNVPKVGLNRFLLLVKLKILFHGLM